MKNDVNGQMDLLDLLGIEKEVEQKPEKETETKNTKETKKTENVSNTSKVSEKKTETKKYKCPIVVYGGPYSYTINEENKEMSSTEVKKHVIKTFPELKGIVTVKMQEDNSCILQVEYKETKLPEIKDQGIFTVKLGKEYVISNEGVEEAVIAWNKKFPQYVGCNYHYVNNNDHVLIPFYKSDSKQVLRAYKLPVLIGFPEMMEQIKPDKDQEDQTISGAEIMERYSKTHPEFKDCTFKYIEHTNTIIPLKEKAVYVPDICMIQLPITVATGGYHIQFSADDFHGKDIVTMEEEINQKERDIERICMKLLMQQQPVANDLRVISAAMKMVSDMERIGDQACDITGIVKKDAEVLTIRENTHLDKMAKATISMVSKSIQSFIKQNLVIAHEVIEQDDIVDELFNRVKKETISLIHEDPEKGEECVAIVMIAKYFERIGDHASNIAEWVEFAITGEYKGGSL